MTEQLPNIPLGIFQQADLCDQMRTQLALQRQRAAESTDPLSLPAASSTLGLALHDTLLRLNFS